MMFAQHDIDMAHFGYVGPLWPILAAFMALLALACLAVALLAVRSNRELREKWRARDERDKMKDGGIIDTHWKQDPE